MSVSAAVSAQETNYELTGQEKIDMLIASIGDIQDRITNSGVMTVGAVGYAAIGGVINDDALSEGIITADELGALLLLDGRRVRDVASSNHSDRLCILADQNVFKLAWNDCWDEIVLLARSHKLQSSRE